MTDDSNDKKPKYAERVGMTPNERKAHLLQGPVTPIGDIIRMGVERGMDHTVRFTERAKGLLRRQKAAQGMALEDLPTDEAQAIKDDIASTLKKGRVRIIEGFFDDNPADKGKGGRG